MNSSLIKLLLTGLWAVRADAISALAPHPRLILTDARLADVKAFIANNSQAQDYYAQVSWFSAGVEMYFIALNQVLLHAAYVFPLPPVARPPDGSGDILAQVLITHHRLYRSAY
jgi:hypothetical protein